MRQLETLLDVFVDGGTLAERLIEIAQAIVVAMDRDGRIAFYNPYLEQLSGIPLEEARGKDWFSTFLPERDHQRIRTLYAKAVAGERVSGNVNPILTRSGEEREIEWSGSFLQDENGETVGVLSVGIDITERRLLEHRLAERERLATIGTTAAMFAHELSNPLNNMALLGKVLAKRVRDLDASEEVCESFDLLLGELRRLGDLLSDFRVLGGPQDLETEPTDLRSLCNEVVRLHVTPHEPVGVQVRWSWPSEFPTVLANRDKLKQVLVNLCKNAVEAMPEGGTLSLHASDQDGRVTVRITDTGSGIPAGLDVFQSFTTTKASGTGLGLPIARQIVVAHGGALTYESAPGNGTTFLLTLPCAGDDGKATA